MRKPFLTGYKRQPPWFQNFKFLNFSVYTTLLVPKQPISIKKAGERFQVCSVSFGTPCKDTSKFALVKSSCQVKEDYGATSCMM